MCRKSSHTSLEAVAAIRIALGFACDKGLPVAVIARQAELSTWYVRKILRGHTELFEKTEAVVDWSPCWRLKLGDELRSSQQMESRRER